MAEQAISENVVPTLTLEGMTLTADAAAATPAAAEAAKPVDYTESLSETEKKQVDAFSEKIDLSNATQVMQYGVASQAKMNSASEEMLTKVNSKDLGEVGKMISGLTVQLKGFGEEEQKGIMGFFKKSRNSLENVKAQYTTVEKNVDSIEASLKNHQSVLTKDVSDLDSIYKLNMQYFKELTMYIAAGKKKLALVRANELPAANQKAKESGNPQDAQRARDIADACDRFEKRLYDLELTRNISIQMAPQIRLIQNNDIQMVDKIQSTIVNTIPLWKNQMVISIGLYHSQTAMEAERAVSDATNDLLKKNAEQLKTGTVAIAKESQRGVVDIETLQQTNKALIDTLDELAKIQSEGQTKRAEAEKQLGVIENDLKNRLMQANK